MTTRSARCIAHDRVLRSVPSRGLHDGAVRHASLTGMIRQPWTVRSGWTSILIRGASPCDLAPVAAMHARCSAHSLLNRYRAGGRRPAIAALDLQLRQPLSFIATLNDGTVIGTAIVARTASTAGMPPRSVCWSRMPGTARVSDAT